MSRPLRAGLSDAAAPPRAGVEGDLARGFLPDLMRLVARNLGREVEFVPLPRRRIFQVLSAGRLDMVCSFAEGWVPEDVRQHLTLSVPLYNEQNVIVASPEGVQVAGGNYASIASLSGVIATVRGYVYGDLEDAFRSGQLTRLDAPDEVTALKMVAHGRARYAVVNRIAYGWFRQDADLAQNLPLPLVILYPQPAYCAVPADGEDSARILEAMRRISASGEISRMVNALVTRGETRTAQQGR